MALGYHIKFFYGDGSTSIGGKVYPCFHGALNSVVLDIRNNRYKEFYKSWIIRISINSIIVFDTSLDSCLSIKHRKLTNNKHIYFDIYGNKHTVNWGY